jgi:hypothetical protein
MKITAETFRKLETMLMAAGMPSADVLISIIGLAADVISPPLPGEAREPDAIKLRLCGIADRLGWDYDEAPRLLSQANEETIATLGFALCVLDDDGHPPHGLQFTSTEFALSKMLTSIIYGTALVHIEADDRRAMDVDAGSAAMLALISRIAVAGGAILYREPETAGERITDLHSAAATIAALPALRGRVAIHDNSYAGQSRSSATAALLSAVLHGFTVMLTTDNLFNAPTGVASDDPDEYGEEDLRTPGTWSTPTPDATRLEQLVPHIPIALLVPIRRDEVLPPKLAGVFVTAIGPMRRDRKIAATKLQNMAGGRLNEAVTNHIVDLWEGRADLAQPSLDAVGRMLDPSSEHPATRDANIATSHPPMQAKTVVAYSALAEAMARGIAPHVWSPVKLQPKAQSGNFHKELFVCEPTASLLFSETLREEANIRIMLLGAPGTGKSAAASYIAANVLGMPTYDVKMSDVLHYKLGALERAIATAFQAARDRQAVLILDEADSIAQDRYSAGPGASHIVTATTNQILLEMDRHPLPIIAASNFGDRIDPAVKRRFDFTFEVLSIPEHLEARAMRLLLGLDLPNDVPGFGGETVVADYAAAKRVLRLAGGGIDAAVEAVGRARDVRLGKHADKGRRIGF